ncbi:MAG: histidine kinase [Bacteroides sp.]
MNSKVSTLVYAALFSGLGVFSFLLLVNYTELPSSVAESLRTMKAFVFFIAVCNVLGYATLQASTWAENQYALNLPHRWRFVVLYALLLLLFLPLNYGLLVIAKLLVNAAHPFTFPNGGWGILITVWMVEVVVVGLVLVNRAMRATLKLQQEAAAMQKANNTARYAALQNQLNPHFLFNSLNTLISEIRYNPANAERFTQHLSDVYRYILRFQEQRLVTLEDELGFLDSYLFLHRVRLGDCLRLDCRLPEECRQGKVPPLTLQLLAENVIKHNAIHQGQPMTLTLRHQAGEGVLVMENPVRPKQTSAPASGTGLKNLDARYRLLCNRSIGITRTAQSFTVKFPLLYE